MSPVRSRSKCRALEPLQAAKAFVRDTQTAISETHLKVARLRAMAADGHDQIAARVEAADLFASVFALKVELERALEDADGALRADSLVRDILRALNVVLEESPSMSAQPET